MIRATFKPSLYRIQREVREREAWERRMDEELKRMELGYQPEPKEGEYENS